MKILVLCNNDLASLFAVNLLLPILERHQAVLGQSSQVGVKQAYPDAVRRLIEFEKNIAEDTGSENALQLFSSVVKQASSEKILNFYQLAERLGKKIIQLNHINSDEGINLVTRFCPDLILSIRFGKILQQPIIDIPKLGVLNLHSGLLPKYQGIMATFWAMLNAEREIGCCLHYIQDKQIDAGNIVQQSPILINSNASYLENLLTIYLSGTQMVATAVASLTQGQELKSLPQRGEPSYFSFPDEVAIEKFEQLGYRLI